MARKLFEPSIPSSLNEWSCAWGSPIHFFVIDRTKLEVSMCLAIVVHLVPLGLLWQKQITHKVEETVHLENVDFIEPEIEQPAPQPVEVQKHKSAS